MSVLFVQQILRNYHKQGFSWLILGCSQNKPFILGIISNRLQIVQEDVQPYCMFSSAPNEYSHGKKCNDDEMFIELTLAFMTSEHVLVLCSHYSFSR